MAIKKFYVTRTQRMAAQAVVEELERQGKPVPPSTRKIANARQESVRVPAA